MPKSPDLLGGLSTITIGGPGEALAVAVLNLTAEMLRYAGIVREGMSQENKDRADVLWIRAFERADRLIERAGSTVGLLEAGK